MTSLDRVFVRLPAGLAVIAALSVAFAATPLRADLADDQDAMGRVVEGPANPVAFAPEETSGEFNVETLNFKTIFESLGEDAILWYQHVQTLANPFFEGRVDGSAGTERARDYLEFYFRSYGLAPAFPAEDEDPEAELVSFRQPFEFTTRGRLTISADEVHASIDGQPFEEGADFTVLGISGSGEVEGPVSFVGYGIESGPDDYSSFDEETDLAGRIALLLRYEPLDENGASRWADERFSRQASMARKMNSVAERGADGIILVIPPGCRDGRTGLEPLNRSVRFGRQLDVPVIQITPEIAEELLQKADPDHRDLMSWRLLADTGEVRTVDLDDDVTVSFGATVERTRNRSTLPGENVAAILPGRGELAGEWLVIGAHYDHNGYGFFGTTPDRGPLYPGADDNASGTAGVLVLAKMLTETYNESDADDLRSVLFITFDAEERGLHGSRYFADHPSIDPEQVNVMINLDMIGRLRSDRLSIIGVGTGYGLEDLLTPPIEASGLTVAITSGGSGRSDDANFQRLNIPAIHFYTGMTEEYTSPADQAYTVNPVGAQKILDLLYDIAMDLTTRSERLAYVEPRPQRGENRGYAPVRLGIRPGVGADLETGVLVESVSLGTSAHAAGIEGGDVLLQWNDIVLDSVRALFEALQEHKPGDRVTILLRRGDELLEVEVTLKAGMGD
jgi:aminopeptidase YwaD